MVPDPHPTPEPDGVRQADPAGPLDPAIEDAIEHRQRRAERLGQAHPPVAEAVDGDRPEPLFAEVVVVGAQVLAHEREEADPRRVEVAVSPVQRGSPINGPGRGLGLDLNLGRFHGRGHRCASRKLNRMKSQSSHWGSVSGLRCTSRLSRYEACPSDQARSASTVATRP